MIQKINIILYKNYLKKAGLLLAGADDYTLTENNTTVFYTINILRRFFNE